jgi:hypothetical protein
MRAGRLPSNSPGFFGALAGIAAGVGCFAYGLAGLADATTAIPLDLAFLIAGFLDVVLCYFALGLSRAAWAFALSLNGTGGLVILFRAIQLGGTVSLLDIGAVLLCAAFVAATVLLSLSSGDYEAG